MATFQLPIATDADGPANNAVGYQLRPETDSSLDYFRLGVVNSSVTGSAEVWLSLAMTLDRETAAEHQLTLVASDSGVPRLSGSLLIVINVEDANDNRPVFDRPNYDVSVPETADTGTEIAVVRATDADDGANGRVRYRFSRRARGREDFRLDERSGIVVVNRRLDFGRQSEYRLGVLAEDDGVGGLASFAMLTVGVLDENDHSPIIDVHTAASDVDIITVDVPRHGSATRFVAHVTVTDDDGDDNGRVMCWLDNEIGQPPSTDALCRPNASSSLPDSVRQPTVAASSTLDRNQSCDDVLTGTAAFDLVSVFADEYKILVTTDGATIPDEITRVEYHLAVTCRDHGFPAAMTSSATVHVTVHYDDSLPSMTPDDVTYSTGNLHPRFVFPVTGNNTIHVTVGAPEGHVVAVVQATGSGNDVSLWYELVDGNGSTYFDVDRTSGHVIVTRRLPASNATLKLIVGVGGASGDGNISMFSLAELYVVVTWTDFPLTTSVASVVGRSDGWSGWSLWFAVQNWRNIVFVAVVSASLVLGTVLFAAIFVVCRKSRRGGGSGRRRRRGKVTSSYHVAVEFRASDDGLNNVAMATAGRAPASLIGLIVLFIASRLRATLLTLR